MTLTFLLGLRVIVEKESIETQSCLFNSRFVLEHNWGEHVLVYSSIQLSSIQCRLHNQLADEVNVGYNLGLL
jgi:hypothetical protein